MLILIIRLTFEYCICIRCASSKVKNLSDCFQFQRRPEKHMCNFTFIWCYVDIWSLLCQQWFSHIPVSICYIQFSAGNQINIFLLSHLKSVNINKTMRIKTSSDYREPIGSGDSQEYVSYVRILYKNSQL